ncbi:MAG TPA: glycosyltransferase family 1 protein [Acidimicrobiales bacterium]|nr:glycosyltransferase family 1 protein [Acidimicrobiales bacterium]
MRRSSEPAARPTIVLDARMRRGGGDRYVTELCAHLPATGQAALRLVTEPAPYRPWGLWAVARECARAGADLLHGLHVEVAPVAAPAVVTIHDVLPLEFPASMPGRARRRVYRRTLDTALARAWRVIVPSEATARAVVRHGADADRVRVVPLGTGPQFRPAPVARRQEARGRFAGGRRYVVAMIGSRAHKNLAGAVAAADRLGADGDLDVLAPGGRPGGRAGAIRFLGRLADPALVELFAGAEATLVPSHVEGFGLPVLESLACGTPVVCGEAVGALSWLRPGVLVVDPADSRETADALRGLAFDGALRDALSEAGRAAAAPLSAEAMATATFAVYREVLTEAAGATR